MTAPAPVDLAVASAVRLRPYVCWPWRLRFLEPSQPADGAACRYCDMEIAAPAVKVKAVCCLYCAIERRFVPLIDEPLDVPLNSSSETDNVRC